MKGLEKELRARLDWYASCVGSGEYDEKAVESILYLLDSMAPLAEGTVPPVDKAWGRFQEILKSRGEMLPLRREEELSLSRKEELGAAEEAVAAAGRIRRFAMRHKGIVAAVLVALVLAVGGGLQAGARRNDGFFFWLKEDEGEKQMITSPARLDGVMELEGKLYFDETDMPDWAHGWLKMMAEFKLSENYEWKCYETSELENFRTILSRYWDATTNSIITIGAGIYREKIFYNYDRYAGYDCVQEYKIGSRQVNIYSRTEESEKIRYVIYSYVDNCRYFIEGGDDLEEIKELMEIYLSFVEK